MASFDKILKKGKRAATPAPPESDKKSEWDKYLAFVLWYLNSLNSMYSDEKDHHLELEKTKCDKCGMAGYLLVAPEFEKEDKIITFNHGDWKIIGRGKYRCPRCK